jgi:hypothetical protein
MARDNHISVICLLSHPTHKMQHLMWPFKTYYSQEVKTFFKNERRCVTPLQVVKLMGSAYMRAAPMDSGQA